MELINHAMATEDFSFPTVPDTPPRFLESPPLWRTSSATTSGHEDTEREDPKGEDRKDDDEEEKEDQFFNFSATNPIKYSERKSFSCIEHAAKTLTEDGLTDQDGSEDDDEEEKMDMLWEDLNEEVLQSRTCGGSRPEFSDMSPGKIMQFGCVKSLKLSRTRTGSVLSGKRPGIVAFMKVLKKLFLIQNSHPKLKIKSSSW